MSKLLIDIPDDQINKYYIDFDIMLIGTLKDFDYHHYNLSVVMSTTAYDTFDDAKKALIEQCKEMVTDANSKLKQAINYK